jgi:hypothetical protein
VEPTVVERTVSFVSLLVQTSQPKLSLLLYPVLPSTLLYHLPCSTVYPPLPSTLLYPPLPSSTLLYPPSTAQGFIGR